MNPCPVFDDFTGTLFLFFIAVLGHTSESYQLVTGQNVTRLCYISSTDGGDTWSPVTDLTKTVIGDTIKGLNISPLNRFELNLESLYDLFILIEIKTTQIVLFFSFALHMITKSDKKDFRNFQKLVMNQNASRPPINI